jgi:hypothetical protein
MFDTELLILATYLKKKKILATQRSPFPRDKTAATYSYKARDNSISPY